MATRIKLAIYEITLIAIVTLCLFSASGCNMLSGFGKDVYLGTKWVEKVFDTGFEPDVEDDNERLGLSR